MELLRTLQQEYYGISDQLALKLHIHLPFIFLQPNKLSGILIFSSWTACIYKYSTLFWCDSTKQIPISIDMITFVKDLTVSKMKKKETLEAPTMAWLI